jgi:hypothetical protein
MRIGEGSALLKRIPPLKWLLFPNSYLIFSIKGTTNPYYNWKCGMWGRSNLITL